MMNKKEDKVPTSLRLKKTTHAYLEKEAVKAGLSLAALLENIIDDYTMWLRQQK